MNIMKKTKSTIGSKIPFVNLRKQYRGIKKEIDGAIKEVLGKGQFVLGDQVNQFEKEFARYCGSKYAIGVASGTDALELSLRALGVKEGDEVITAPNSAVATAMAILAVGAKPVFVDIESGTLNINPELVERSITSKTKVILPVHLFGNPAEMDKILKIAKKHKLAVIEDACQAHGAKYLAKKAGTWGKMGCFSFYQTKNLGAYGDGGAVVTNDKRLYKILLALRQYGWNEKKESEMFGRNSRLDEIQAAVLRVKLRHLNDWTQKRRQIAKSYGRLLKKTPLKLPTENGFHVFHLYVVQTPLRNKLKSFLEKRGIKTTVHYPVIIPSQPYFSKLGYKNNCCPEAEKINSKILSLPIYPEMTTTEVKKICQTIKEFFKIKI